MDFDALFIAFGIANLLAAIPITPGGLGYVDTGYIGMLVGFGAAAGGAALGVAAYRFAQFFFPILIGGLTYLSLRVGPWSIERRDRLMRLRDLAEEEARRGETQHRLPAPVPDARRHRRADPPPAHSAAGAGPFPAVRPASQAHAAARRVTTSMTADVLAWGVPRLRDLPWRRTRDPWAVLVSEVMLQQTQVTRVIPRWESFLVRFPTTAACADGTARRRLREWQGLGYPRRARNLHATAQRVEDLGGFPRDLDGPARAAGHRPVHGAGAARVRVRARCGGGRHEHRPRLRQGPR